MRRVTQKSHWTSKTREEHIPETPDGLAERRRMILKQIEFHLETVDELRGELQRLPVEAALSRADWLKQPLASVFGDDFRLLAAFEDRFGVQTLEQFLALRKEELLEIPNFGEKGLAYVYSRLEEIGFTRNGNGQGGTYGDGEPARGGPTTDRRAAARADGGEDPLGGDRADAD